MGGKDRRKAADFIILALASVGAPYVLLQAAGTAMFLLSHGGAMLPYVYLCVAFGAALITWGFVWLETAPRADCWRSAAGSGSSSISGPWR